MEQFQRLARHFSAASSIGKGFARWFAAPTLLALMSSFASTRAFWGL
jgi:hypothetical protein